MAVIGYGGVAGYHHKRLREGLPQIKITGAYDIREEAISNIVKQELKLYSSPDELYSDKAIDLVLIATPNDVHAPYAVACLEAGKNVIVEKPVCLNSAELSEVIKVSERCKKLFTSHQNRRWDTDYMTVKKIIAEKILDMPYYIESRVQGSRGGIHGWRGHKINGGGMVYDWGVHLIDQMLDLIKEPVVSIYAQLHYVNSTEVDDVFSANLRFKSGFAALINISMNCFIVQPRWHVCSKNGTVEIVGWESKGKIVKLANTDDLEWAEEIVYTAAGPTRSMAPRPKHTVEELPLPKVEGDALNFYKNIEQVLNGKEEPAVKTHEMLRVMNVIDNIFISGASGKSVSCEI